VTTEHPHDITVAFGGLVEKGLLMSEGSGRSTFFCRPGRHPMEGGCSELPGSVRSRAPNICQGTPNIWMHCAGLQGWSDLCGKRRRRWPTVPAGRRRRSARCDGSENDVPKERSSRNPQGFENWSMKAIRLRRCYARLVREGNARGGGAVIQISLGNCQCKLNGTEKGRFRGAFFRIGTAERSDIAERQG